MARPQSEVLAGRETRRRRLKLIPVSANVLEEPPHRIRRRSQAQSRLSDQETVFTSPRSLSEQLDNPIYPLNGSMLIAEKEKKPESRDKRRPIILALARLNAAQTGPEFPSVFDKRLIEEVYADKNLDQDGMKNPTKIRHNGGAAFQARNAFIEILEDPGSHSEVVVRRTMALVDEIRNMYPYYRDLTIPQIVGILRRTIDFSEILKPATDPIEKGLSGDFTATEETDGVMNLPIWKPIISDPTPPDVPLFLRHLREVNAQPPGDNYLGTPVRNPPQGWRPISNVPLNNRK